MAKSSHPSLPPSSERSPERLAPRGAAGERPVRAQLVVAGMLLLLFIAVPLYFLRRPSGSENAVETNTAALAFGGVIRQQADAATGGTDVVLGPVQRVRCGPSANQIRGEGALCDALPPLEEALRRTLAQSEECVPETGKEGSINYVLEVDFENGRLNVFPGQSGKWRGPQARKSTNCIMRNLPELAWTEIPHQHDYYAIAILATYPAPPASEELPRFD